MPTSERIAAAVVIIVAGAVFVGGAFVFGRGLLRCLRRRPRRPVSRWRRWGGRLLATLAAVELLCLGYAWFIEPNWLEVAHVRIVSGKIPAGAGGIRIVLLSDTHCEATGRLEDRVVAETAAAGPDLIVFTGDAVNDDGGVAVFRRLMTRLAAIAPTFACQGNFESEADFARGLYDGTGAVLLRGSGRELDVRGIKLWIGGAAYPHSESAMASLLAAAPRDALVILLCHKPEGVLAVSSGAADLFCCGHTHGGQVRLPWYGALVTLSRTGKQYEAGLYKRDDMWVYVSRGVGLEPLPAPQVRFLCRPELTIIDVAGSGGGTLESTGAAP